MFNLENLFDAVVEGAKFPNNVFKGGARVVFGFLIPMFFVATLPTQILLGKSSWEMVFITILFLIGSTFASQWFWNFALKRYSSASS